MFDSFWRKCMSYWPEVTYRFRFELSLEILDCLVFVTGVGVDRTKGLKAGVTKAGSMSKHVGLLWLCLSIHWIGLGLTKHGIHAHCSWHYEGHLHILELLLIEVCPHLLLHVFCLEFFSTLLCRKRKSNVKQVSIDSSVIKNWQFVCHLHPEGPDSPVLFSCAIGAASLCYIRFSRCQICVSWWWGGEGRDGAICGHCNGVCCCDKIFVAVIVETGSVSRFLTFLRILFL